MSQDLPHPYEYAGIDRREAGRLATDEVVRPVCQALPLVAPASSRDQAARAVSMCARAQMIAIPLW
jgi:hypothetical protein